MPIGGVAPRRVCAQPEKQARFITSHLIIALLASSSLPSQAGSLQAQAQAEAQASCPGPGTTSLAPGTSKALAKLAAASKPSLLAIATGVRSKKTLKKRNPEAETTKVQIPEEVLPKKSTPLTYSEKIMNSEDHKKGSGVDWSKWENDFDG